MEQSICMAKDGSAVLKVFQEDPELADPRSDSNLLGHMVCWHRIYNFGNAPQDVNVKNDDQLAGVLSSIIAEELKLDIDQQVNVENYNSTRRLLDIVKRTKTVIIPIYLLDHGGLWMSTDRGFFDMIDPGSWDHGQVGFIYATSKDIKEKLGVQDLTEETVSMVKEILREEVRTYSMYLSGNVYYYVLEDEKMHEEIDSAGQIYAENLIELREAIRAMLPSEYAPLADELDG